MCNSYELKTGDVVKGNTHNYKMTVENSNEKTDCIYFDYKQNIHRVVYKIKGLILRRVAIG